MMRNVKKDASVTVPLCMMILAMAALLFALVEGVRYYGLKADAKDGTKLAVESLFAGYQPLLLEEYGMFFLDGNFGGSDFRIEGAEDEIKAVLYENLIAENEAEGIGFYRMQSADAEVTGYQLATDAKGKVFEMQSAKAMKKKLGKQAAKKLLEKILGVEKQTQNAKNPEEAIADANQALKEIEEKKKTEKESGGQSKKKSTSDEKADLSHPAVENPLDTIKKLKKEGILTLVLPSGKTVSEKTCDTADCLMKRSCRTGTWACEEKPGWYERILMQEFLKPLIGNAVMPKETGSLSYGTEYLICGKDSDKENLKKTVNKLLLLRETVNFLYLQTDESKKAEALAAASAAGGALAAPAIPVIEQGILAAWAYVESLCDVRALLSGGKIPLLKSPDTWHTQLSNLSEIVKTDYVGEQQGLSYETYLDVLLYAKTVKQIAYRSMDLMEWQLKSKTETADCRMDHMITGIQFSAEYDADTLFFDIFGEDSVGGYRFLEREEYLYGP